MVISTLFFFIGYQLSGGFKRSNQWRQRIIMRLFNTFKRCHILQRGPKKNFCALAIVKTAWIEARANLLLGT